jgi:hypothetical protein
MFQTFDRLKIEYFLELYILSICGIDAKGKKA